MSDETITLTVNGRERPVTGVSPWTTLLTALREHLRLTGAKRGCNQGVCGACTVMIDGRPMRSCLSLAINCEGREITTVEGLAAAGELAPVQQAIMDGNGLQCGFCTPGMLISAQALLDRKEKLTEADVQRGLSGNLCRCSGYRKIVQAIVTASEAAA
jgi:aerobic-type carbon monoxide dehydrogenase small subunit (CoxS/CutS family)